MHALYAVVTWTERHLPYIIIIIIIIIEIFAINVLRNVQTSSNATEITSFWIPTWNLRGSSVFHVSSSIKLSLCQLQIGFSTDVDISRRQAIAFHWNSINCYGCIKLICLLIIIFIFWFFFTISLPLLSLFFSIQLNYWFYEWLWSPQFTLLHIYIYILASQDIQRIQHKMRGEERSVS